MRFFFPMFLMLLLVGWSPAALAGRSQMTAQETYELGERYLKRGYYLKALEQFNRVRTYFRDDPYALRAEIAIADMHFEKNEWDAARIAYEEFLRAHPASSRRSDGSVPFDYVFYRLGMTHYKKAPIVPDRDQAWTRQAVNTWSSFSARFPESEHKPEVEKLLKKARDRLAKKEMVIAAFYEQRKAPLAVQGRILGMLQRYPDSPDVPRALVMLGLSYVQTNQPDMAQAVLKRLEEDYPAYAGVLKLRRVLVAPVETPAPAAAPTTAPAATP